MKTKTDNPIVDEAQVAATMQRAQEHPDLANQRLELYAHDIFARGGGVAPLYTSRGEAHLLVRTGDGKFLRVAVPDLRSLPVRVHQCADAEDIRHQHRILRIKVKDLPRSL